MVTDNTNKGRRRAIRAFLSSAPNSTSREIAAGINHPSDIVSRELSRMRKAGSVTVVCAHNNNRYTNAEAAPVIPPPPKPAKKIMRAIITSQTKPKPEATRIHAETSEEFAARGGKIEVLPVAWSDADHYPRPTFSERPAVGHGGTRNHFA